MCCGAPWLTYLPPSHSCAGLGRDSDDDDDDDDDVFAPAGWFRPADIVEVSPPGVQQRTSYFHSVASSAVAAALLHAAPAGPSAEEEVLPHPHMHYPAHACNCHLHTTPPQVLAVAPVEVNVQVQARAEEERTHMLRKLRIFLRIVIRELFKDAKLKPVRTSTYHPSLRVYWVCL